MYGVSSTFMPGWLRPTLESIAPLLKLQAGWDSYGGQPIDQRVVKTAIEVLFSVMADDSPVPAIVPTSSGGLQLEWHRGGSDLEIMLAPSGEAIFDFENASGEEIEGNVFEQTGTLADLISRLPK
jgi:hypothetical protein